MEKKRKLLSVIIPVHNRLPLFIKCLRSVFSQRGPYDIEVLVVDDGSFPTAKSYLKKLSTGFVKRVKLFRNKSNIGPARSRNVGLKHTSGDYIVFLDSDDIWHKNFSVKMIAKLEVSGVAIATCFLNPRFVEDMPLSTKIFYSFLSLTRTICFYTMLVFNKGELAKQFFYMTRLSGTVFRRNAIGKVRFSEDYKAAEDWKFVYDCIQSNKVKIDVLPKKLVNFSYTTESETLGRTDYFKYYLKLLKSIPIGFRNSFGIRLFRAYTYFAIWKNRLPRNT